MLYTWTWLKSVGSEVRAHAGATLRREEGATMVEYGLLVALIALVAIAGVILLGNALNALFSDTAGRLPAPPAP